jgi:hypothetical protein
MAFKFNLGDIVVATQSSEKKPALVEAIQLRGYIQIKPLDEVGRLLVKEDDYELWMEKEAFRPDN